jgi:hypothetical protein
VLETWRRINGMISDDPRLQRRQKVALAAVVMSIPLVGFGGFVGAAVMSGDSDSHGVWARIAIVALALGFSLAVGGNLVWRWSRMHDGSGGRTVEPTPVTGMNPEHRNLLIFIVTALGLLPINAVVMALYWNGHDVAAAVVSLFGFAYAAGCFILARKLGLRTHRP